jgi:hypothetical protein
MRERKEREEAERIKELRRLNRKKLNMKNFGTKLKMMKLFGGGISNKEFPISKENLRKQDELDRNQRQYRSFSNGMGRGRKAYNDQRLNQTTLEHNKTYLEKTLDRIEPFLNKYTNIKPNEMDQIDTLKVPFSHNS